MEDIFLRTTDDRVAGIVSPLATDNNINIAGQDIDDFAFAFIPPLGAYENGVRHGLLREKAGGESGQVVKNRQLQGKGQENYQFSLRNR